MSLIFSLLTYWHWLLLAVVCVLLAYCLSVFLSLATRRYRAQFETNMSRGLGEVFLFHDVRVILIAHSLIVLAVSSVMLYVTQNFVISITLALGMGVLPRVLLKWMKQRRIAKFREQIPDALSLIAGGLKAGSSLTQMIALAAQRLSAPSSQEFMVVMRQQRVGVTLEKALKDLVFRVPTEETKLLAAAVMIGSQSGGSTAQALESLSETTRRKIALEGKIDALTAQGRLQAWVMAVLPFVLAGALCWIDPEGMSKLITTSLGWVVLAVVLFLQGLGAFMIRKIVAIVI